MCRLLALDLDGTLLTPGPTKIITPRAYRALHQVAARGVIIVIATGQRLPVLQDICKGLPLVAPQISDNGATTVDIHTGRIVHSKPIPRRLILPTLETLRSLGLFRVYYSPERVYVDRGTPGAREWYRPPVPPVIEVDDVTSLHRLSCIRLGAVGEAGTLRAKRQELKGRFADRLNVTQSASFLLDILHPQASKGSALQSITEELGISPQEVVAFGDNHNDISMLQFAGLGIAMGNATGEAQAAADYVTASNAEDGVAVAIEELILPQT
jgi:Cof subfamily protein (haloacid dehalogenase superfamily)